MSNDHVLDSRRKKEEEALPYIVNTCVQSMTVLYWYLAEQNEFYLESLITGASHNFSTLVINLPITSKKSRYNRFRHATADSAYLS
jgi:hypothetical protein